MFDLPRNPHSVAIVVDGEEVFLSFHWSFPAPFFAHEFSEELGRFMDEQVRKSGLIAVEFSDEGQNGAQS